MPLTDIQIEQVGPDEWHANLETGSLTSRRAHYRGETLEQVMLKATLGYYELSGTAPPRAVPAAGGKRKE